MAADPPDGTASDRIQVNVTFKRGTLETLKDQFPSALEDSERVRRAVDQALDINQATEVSLSRA